MYYFHILAKLFEIVYKWIIFILKIRLFSDIEIEVTN